ncbi:hypothetical protein BGZ92_006594 [Podila epicladia]|nr:hypothetical protein BGZ92_006594 [Podila epicladia]
MTKEEVTLEKVDAEKLGHIDPEEQLELEEDDSPIEEVRVTVPNSISITPQSRYSTLLNFNISSS